ncbi:spastin [Parasteatoda tepidariorum]|nr:spastin [Parasteatoda tepidariorum]
MNRETRTTNSKVYKLPNEKGNSRSSYYVKKTFSVILYPFIFLFSSFSFLFSELFKLFRGLCTSTKDTNNTIRTSIGPCEDGNKSLVPDTDMDTSNPFSVQRHHHRKAFDLISKALKIDEENYGPKNLAIELYRQGIDELKKGIAVDCSVGSSQTVERSKRLHEKMCTNLSMAQDRLYYLENLNSPNLETLETNPSRRRTWQQPAPLKLNVCFPDVTGGDKNPSPTSPITNESKKQIRKFIPPSKSFSVPRTLPSSPRRTPTMLPKKKPTSPTNVRRQIPASNMKRDNSKNSIPIQSRLQKLNKISSLKGVDPKLAQMIMDEIVDGGPSISFDDIAGQNVAKQALHEMVILPTVRPELFTGLRTPPKGLLLFGPPGNGKTMLAKAVACESNSTFLNISAASLTSKYVGEGEKLVRALFAVARELQPTIVFIDEVDSLLNERKENEHEASRRLKTEFLVEFDGLRSDGDDRILVMGATNRPQELDDAALRRFSKRVYVALPNQGTRIKLLEKLLSKQDNSLSKSDIKQLAKLTDGYSGSDLTGLAKDASLGPIRELNPEQVKCVDPKEMRKVSMSDFTDSLKRIRRSVAAQSLAFYSQWNSEYGDVTI